MNTDAVVPVSRLGLWKTGALAIPAMLFLFVEALPLYSGTMTPLERHLQSMHWLALFLSPALLPWVLKSVWASWPESGARIRGGLLILALLALVASIEAARWAYQMAYPPPGDPVPLPPDAQ